MTDDDVAMNAKFTDPSGTVTPPAECHEGAVWRHKPTQGLSRIQRVYWNVELLEWRVVLAGGQEFVDQSRYPGARRVPNAMPIDRFLRWWAYERD